MRREAYGFLPDGWFDSACLSNCAVLPKDNPQVAIDLLSAHKSDESEYVRKSVGNAIRDISKKHSALVVAELSTWDLSSKEVRQVYKLASKFIEK